MRRALGADFLLAGRARAGDGGALAVDVYLTDLRGGERVWQDSYVSPSGELLHVRNALFVLLSSRLQTMLAGDKQLPLPPASTLNAEAYRAYLRGAYSRERHSTEGLKRAIAECRAALALDPEDWSNYSYLAMAQLKLGRYEEALASAETAYGLERTGGNLALLGSVHAYAGEREAAARILRELRAAPASLNVSKYDLAVVHAAPGERDEAFRLLGEEVVTLSVDLLSIRIDPLLDPLRDDPRFPPLEARYDFPPDPRRAAPAGARGL